MVGNKTREICIIKPCNQRPPQRYFVVVTVFFLLSGIFSPAPSMWLEVEQRLDGGPTLLLLCVCMCVYVRESQSEVSRPCHHFTKIWERLVSS